MPSFKILQRAVCHRSAGVGDDFQIVAVGIGEPAVAADENAVRERYFGIEETDFLEQFDRRAALALHDGVELEEIDRRVDLNSHSRILCRFLGLL